MLPWASNMGVSSCTAVQDKVPWGVQRSPVICCWGVSSAVLWGPESPCRGYSRGAGWLLGDAGDRRWGQAAPWLPLPRGPFLSVAAPAGCSSWPTGGVISTALIAVRRPRTSRSPAGAGSPLPWLLLLSGGHSSWPDLPSCPPLPSSSLSPLTTKAKGAPLSPKASPAGVGWGGMASRPAPVLAVRG